MKKYALLLLIASSCAVSPPQEESSASAVHGSTDCIAQSIPGIDVSHYQPEIDWFDVRRSGRTFAFVRVTDGLTTIDTQFANSWPHMKTANVIRGAYQFFRPRRDPVELANLMLDIIRQNGGLLKGDFPPVLDIEVTDDQPADVVVTKAQAWLDRVQEVVGVKPIVYTGNHMTPTIGPTFLDYPLWLAHYNVACPRIPQGWKHWTWWQSGGGMVPGTGPDPIDIDWFDGTIDDLRKWTLKADVVIPVMPPPAHVLPDRENARAGGNAMGMH